MLPAYNLSTGGALRFGAHRGIVAARGGTTISEKAAHAVFVCGESQRQGEEEERVTSDEYSVKGRKEDSLGLT